MILRIFALIFGLSGAASLSQFPEFAQQYLQRLAGKVDQLGEQVAGIDEAAASFDMTRDEYLADLSQSRTGEAAAEQAERNVSLYERLFANISAFRDAGAFGRLLQAWRVADPETAQRTFADYKPALPLSTEGATFAAVGFAAGYGIWSMLWGIFGWPVRRRRRRRLAELEARYADAAGNDDAAFEEDDDDAPLVEYEGDLAAAMNRDVPDITLAAHDGTVINLAALTAPIALFTYPLMGRPGVAFPEGWEEVDGGDAGTEMACSFRDAQDMMRRAGIKETFGISSQSPEDQREAAYRLNLPYTLLSDTGMKFAFALDLPRFILGHDRYLAPAVIIVQQGKILAGLHPIKDASTAATRLLEKLEKARQAHQRKQTA